jgi:hypothetical protein
MESNRNASGNRANAAESKKISESIWLDPPSFKIMRHRSTKSLQLLDHLSLNLESGFLGELGLLNRLGERNVLGIEPLELFEVELPGFIRKS